MLRLIVAINFLVTKLCVDVYNLNKSYAKVNKFTAVLYEEEGKQLLRDAIAGGVFNDAGSGGCVNLCVIRKNSVNYLRPYEVTASKGKQQGSYTYARGTTAVLSCTVVPLEIVEHTVRRTDSDSMEVA